MTGMSFPADLHAPVPLSDLLERIRRNASLFDQQFPTVGEGTRYKLGANDNWLAGFWTGLLWLAYAATGDDDLKHHAQTLLPTFAARLDQRIHITHDLGFLFTLSARAQWQLMGDTPARDLALRAAADLAQRFIPQGGYIQAWGALDGSAEHSRAIIDTMMNVPLLFWAAHQTGDDHYHTIARQHVETTARTLVRPDGAAYHTYFFDPHSGEPLRPSTHQGYADDSLWARGQAWTIYGFAVAAAWCDDPTFLDVSRHAAERFLDELPPGGVPWWDLRLPAGAPHHRDSSAGAIAATGILRLAAQVGGDTGAALRDRGVALLQHLIDACLETLPDAQGLLRGGTYHAHKGWGVDEYFICGDYFFLEALLMLAGSLPDFWEPLRH